MQRPQYTLLLSTGIGPTILYVQDTKKSNDDECIKKNYSHLQIGIKVGTDEATEVLHARSRINRNYEPTLMKAIDACEKLSLSSMKIKDLSLSVGK